MITNDIIRILCNTTIEYYLDRTISPTQNILVQWYQKQLFLRTAFVSLEYDKMVDRYFLYALNPMEIIDNCTLWDSIRDNIKQELNIDISIGKFCLDKNEESYFIYDDINKYLSNNNKIIEKW